MSSRSRSAVVTSLAVAVVAGVGVVAFAILRSDDGGDVTLGDPTPSPDATVTEPEPVCGPPDLRPAVLPWVDDGEEVPPPDVVHEGDESSYAAWLGEQAEAEPDQSWEGPVVSLRSGFELNNPVTLTQGVLPGRPRTPSRTS